MSELGKPFDGMDEGTPTPVPEQVNHFGRPSIESGYAVQVYEAGTGNDGDRATYKPGEGGQYLALVNATDAAYASPGKAGSSAIDIRTPKAIREYQEQMDALAKQYMAQQGSAVSATTMVQPRSNSVTSPWARPSGKSNVARNLIVGGALALAAVGAGLGASLSRPSSADSTPAAVAIATSAQASAVLDAGIVAPAPATSASAKVPAVKALDSGLDAGNK